MSTCGMDALARGLGLAGQARRGPRPRTTLPTSVTSHAQRTRTVVAPAPGASPMNRVNLPGVGWARSLDSDTSAPPCPSGSPTFATFRDPYAAAPPPVHLSKTRNMSQ